MHSSTPSCRWQGRGARPARCSRLRTAELLSRQLLCVRDATYVPRIGAAVRVTPVRLLHELTKPHLTHTAVDCANRLPRYHSHGRAFSSDEDGDGREPSGMRLPWVADARSPLRDAAQFSNRASSLAWSPIARNRTARNREMLMVARNY